MGHILNEYFEKIYCITGHNFDDRHAFMSKSLEGIDFEWIISPPAEHLIAPSGRTQTEMSNILGHASCVWNAKIRGFKRIAIFEDDVTLIATEEEMRPFFSELPDNWDFLYLSNPSWSAGIWDSWDTWTKPYSEHVKRVYWGNSSSFNAIQSHVYDVFTTQIVKGLDPGDFTYFKLFQKRNNSFCPAKKFFGDTFSTPHESVIDKFPSDRFLPSRIQHSF